MSALSKLKYFIATIVFLVICILLTAYQAKINTTVEGVQIALNFTYCALFVCAFLFGGIVTGIAGVAGVCLYILLKDQSAWLALLGLVIGLVFGIITKITTSLMDRKKLDQRALLINGGIFFIAVGVVFTAAMINATDNTYYIVKNSDTYIYFHWSLFVLPYILGATFILAAIFLNKTKESIRRMFCISAFVSSSAIVLYGIVCVLCSIKKISFSLILANAYNTYFQGFFFSICLGLIIAMIIYAIGNVIVEVRRAIKNALNDAE